MKSSKKSATQRNAGPPPAQLPISALLSFALVAFTIEFDNEFEHRMPHRITNSNPEVAGVCRGPWLTSLVMYCNCMRFVDEQGIRASELEKLARTPTNLNGMERWGYITVAPDPNDPTPKPPRSDLADSRHRGRPRRPRNLAPTLSRNRKPLARAFRPERSSKRLQNSLRKLVAHFDEQSSRLSSDSPVWITLQSSDRSSIAARADLKYQRTNFHLSALLSRSLLAFALEFESESEISLAVGANILRVLRDEKHTASEIISAIAGGLDRIHQHGVGNPAQKTIHSKNCPAEKGGRGKLICLTPIWRRLRTGRVSN